MFLSEYWYWYGIRCILNWHENFTLYHGRRVWHMYSGKTLVRGKCRASPLVWSYIYMLNVWSMSSHSCYDTLYAKILPPCQFSLVHTENFLNPRPVLITQPFHSFRKVVTVANSLELANIINLNTWNCLLESSNQSSGNTPWRLYYFGSRTIFEWRNWKYNKVFSTTS